MTSRLVILSWKVPNPMKGLFHGFFSNSLSSRNYHASLSKETPSDENLSPSSLLIKHTCSKQGYTRPPPFLLWMQSSFTHTRTEVFRSPPPNTHQPFFSLLVHSWQHVHVLAVPTAFFTYLCLWFPFRVYLQKFVHIYCCHYLPSILSLPIPSASHSCLPLWFFLAFMEPNAACTFFFSFDLISEW